MAIRSWSYGRDEGASVSHGHVVPRRSERPVLVGNRGRQVLVEEVQFVDSLPPVVVEGSALHVELSTMLLVKVVHGMVRIYLSVARARPVSLGHGAPAFPAPFVVMAVDHMRVQFHEVRESQGTAPFVAGDVLRGDLSPV